MDATDHSARPHDNSESGHVVNRFTTSDGRSLAFRDEGTGPPVLCLAGLTRDMADFDDLAAVIGNDVRLIRMDYRGRGASDHDPDPANYAIPVETRDALELLDHLSVDAVTVIGTSRGGMVAMGMAAMARDRLRGVVLNDVGPELDPAGLEDIRVMIGRNPAFATHEDAASELARINSKSFPGVPVQRWLQLSQRWWRQGPDGLTITYDPRLAEPVLAVMDGPKIDLWPFFDAFKGLPLALLRGANSRLLSVETTAKMRERRPDMIFAEIPDRAHVPFLDEPQSVAAIQALLARSHP